MRRVIIHSDEGRPDHHGHGDTGSAHHHDHEHGQHDHGDDHDHDHGPAPDSALLEIIEGLERHTLHSVGIDIGSSTSHLAVSRLVIQRRGSELSSEFVVSQRETLYQSQIWLTPYLDDGSAIDVSALTRLFEFAYRQAGVAPHEMDTGAVVITGEALKKQNAEHIARMIARWSGVFICVSAGPYHEALLAAHGSGSVALSKRIHGTVVNVDLGGGTTKLSVVRDGEVTHLEAFSVGARLLAFDEHDRIVRIEEPALVFLKHLELSARLGDTVRGDDRRRLARVMADTVIGAILSGDGSRPELYADLLVASDERAMPPPADIDAIVISGGVSEYLSSTPPAAFGDLGDELGRALRAGLASAHLEDRVHTAAQGIRATVIGASQFTVQASGQTCYLSDLDVLPVSGLRAVHLDFRAGSSEEVIRRALRQHDLDAWHPGLAAAVILSESPTYSGVRACAEALVATARHDPQMPLFVVLRQDLGHSLGAVIREELRWLGPVIVVDGITVGELDHVDLGRPLGTSKSLPVTVTSLAFPDPPDSHTQWTR